MPIRISERRLLFAALLFAAGLYTLYAVKLITAPVYISEKGIFIAAAACVALVLGVRLFKGIVKEV